MNRRIDTVQPVGQHSYSRKSIGQGFPMSMHINAIGQTADNQHIGTQSRKVTKEIGTELFPIIGSMTGTYHTDYPQAVQVGVSLEEQDDRGILTLTQTRGITFVSQGQTVHTVLLGPLQFFLSPEEGRRVIECGYDRSMDDTRITFRQLRAESEHLGRTAHGIHQPLGTNMSDTRTKGQGDTANSFVGIHGFQI